MPFSPDDQRCPNCQHPTPPGAPTCEHCGLTLADAAPTPHDYGSAPLYDFPSPPAAAQPPIQPTLRKSPKIRLLLLAALVVLVLGGGSVAAYVFTRPSPALSVSSDYTIRSIPVGAASTVFHISGQRFSDNSQITFLLDGRVAPDSPSVFSDSSGHVTASLKVSDHWSLGPHTLTARDARNYRTQAGVQIDIVPPGEATTPGPHGAPTNSSDFNVIVMITRQDAVTGKPLNAFKVVLTVHGMAPANQQVCQAQSDTGQQQIYIGSDSTGDYQEIFAWTCSGSYQQGKLSYTETTITDTLTYFNGMTCIADTPYTFIQLDGTFSAADAISGVYAADTVQYRCDRGGTLHLNPEKGTWQGSTS